MSSTKPADATTAYEIQGLIYRFFFYLDEQEYDELTALMAPTGVWHRNGKALKGPEGVMEAMKMRPVGFTTRHLITNIMVDVDGADRAQATFYMTVFVHTGDARPSGPLPIELPLHCSVFSETFVRTAQGWRIAELEGSATFHRT